MSINHTRLFLIVFILHLNACAKQPQAISPTATIAPTELPTKDPTDPLSTIDPSLFGSLSKSDIDPLASKIYQAIFTKVMDGFIASGNIIEYQLLNS